MVSVKLLLRAFFELRLPPTSCSGGTLQPFSLVSRNPKSVADVVMFAFLLGILAFQIHTLSNSSPRPLIPSVQASSRSASGAVGHLPRSRALRYEVPHKTLLEGSWIDGLRCLRVRGCWSCGKNDEDRFLQQPAASNEEHHGPATPNARLLVTM